MKQTLHYTTHHINKIHFVTNIHRKKEIELYLLGFFAQNFQEKD